MGNGGGGGGEVDKLSSHHTTSSEKFRDFFGTPPKSRYFFKVGSKFTN